MRLWRRLGRREARDPSVGHARRSAQTEKCLVADNMTREQRSRTMSRIRSKDTKCEVTMRSLLHGRGWRFRVHASNLPGCPDIVFPRFRVAVFIDGDFWHGWRFDQWSHKLGPYWREKITRNRARDRQHASTLRSLGWRVVRLWEHQVERHPEKCLKKIEDILALSLAANRPSRARPKRRAELVSKRTPLLRSSAGLSRRSPRKRS